jgi:hypothetical protein
MQAVSNETSQEMVERLTNALNESAAASRVALEAELR